MGTISIVVVITLTFAVANLFAQLLAMEAVRRHEEPRLPAETATPQHAYHARIEGMPRLRTDRHDLQQALGYDFAAPDVEHRVWERDPRI